EALADSSHRRADELLAVLAEEEPSALCRAVERWARDERADRRGGAGGHRPRPAPRGERHPREGAGGEQPPAASASAGARTGDVRRVTVRVPRSAPQPVRAPSPSATIAP
ncbi:hypothetical protein EF913_29215, partial [Streptomyces sp. WAC04189]|uniref:hypothetical protein n=1 Tax=Streptomyces sp. WAC04189 TaxID=2487411 RepID=UPI000FB32EB2